MKLLKILLFLSLLSLPLYSMDDNNNNNLITPEEKAQAALEGFINDLKDNPEKQEELVDAGLGEFLGPKRRDMIKWGSTLLTPEDYSYGLYKGDIVEVVKTVSDIYADNLMRKSLLKKRVNLILDSLISDSSEICHIIEVIEETREKWDQEYLDKSTWQRLSANPGERWAQANPLINYIAEHHKLFGRIPLTTKTIAPLTAHWLWNKVSNAIYARYSAATWPESIASNLFSYKTNDEGTLILTKKQPFGLLSASMRLVRFLYNPLKYGSQVNLDLLKRTNNFLHTFSPIKLPAILQGKTAAQAYDLLGVCLGAKLYDKLYTKQWTLYAVKHRVVLRELLLTYEKTLRTGGDLKEAEKDLLSFIERGHRDKGFLPGSMLGHFWQTSLEGKNTLASYIQYGLIASILGKVAWSYYTNK